MTAACLVLAACGGKAVDPQAAASSAARASQLAAAEERRVAANSAAAVSESSAAAASSSAAAEASASEAAASASAAAEAAKPKPPTSFSGTGDSVVRITKPAGLPSSLVAVTVKGNSGSRYFGVKGVDGDQDTLVNTTDPYNGTTLMDVNGGNTTELQVQATGVWSITISDIRAMPTFSPPAPATGAGDAVLVYQGASGIGTIKGNSGSRYFGVRVYTGSDDNSLVNTTDPYTGSVPWPAGPAIVVVTATGGWSISVA